MDRDELDTASPSPDRDAAIGIVPLVVHKFVVRQTALTSLSLPDHRGTALRGVLLEALRHRFCALVARGQPEAQCGSIVDCQICALIAGEGSIGRGKEPPRPYTLQPPVSSHARLVPGDELVWGFTLFGKAERYVPYLVIALQEIGTLGRKEHGQPGQVALRDMWAVNPLVGDACRVVEGKRADVRLPHLGVEHRQVLDRARDLEGSALTVRLHTPTRLIEENRPVRRLTLETLLFRIVGRLSDLGIAYGDGAPQVAVDCLRTRAARVRITDDSTIWRDVESPSGRLQRTTPIGGLVGTLRLEGDFAGELAPLLRWLVWGSLIGVGKDTTKGNGWLTIERGYTLP